MGDLGIKSYEITYIKPVWCSGSGVGLGVRKSGFLSPLSHGNPLGDFGPGTYSQPSLPHRVVVVRITWRGITES